MMPLRPPGPATGTDQELATPAILGQISERHPGRAGPRVCFDDRLLRLRGQAHRAARRPEGQLGPRGQLARCEPERSRADQPLIPDQMHAQLLRAEGRAERGQDQRQARGGIGRHQPVGEAVQPGQLAVRGGVHRLSRQQGHHVVRVGAQRVQIGDDPALPQHQDPVGQPEHLVDVVAREQDRGALFPQPGDELLDLGRLDDPERCGGLVEGQQPRLAAHGAGHGHQLALAARQGADQAGGVPDRDTETVQQRRRGRVETAFREDHPARLPAEQNVRRHVEVLAQRQVLPDHGDALAGHSGRVRVDLAAGEEDLALRGGDVPGNAADQRRLAGAVLPGQGDKLTGADRQVHPVKGPHGPECDTETGHGQQWRRHYLGQLGSCNHVLIVWPVPRPRYLRAWAPDAASSLGRAGARPRTSRSPPLPAPAGDRRNDPGREQPGGGDARSARFRPGWLAGRRGPAQRAPGDPDRRGRPLRRAAGQAGWQTSPAQAVVLPLPGETGGQTVGVIVLAASAGRALDEAYLSFPGWSPTRPRA